MPELPAAPAWHLDTTHALLQKLLRIFPNRHHFCRIHEGRINRRLGMSQENHMQKAKQNSSDSGMKLVSTLTLIFADNDLNAHPLPALHVVAADAVAVGHHAIADAALGVGRQGLGGRG